MHPGGHIDADEVTPLIGSSGSIKASSLYIYMVAGLSAIGGFLFGYDTGIISGAMIFVRDQFELNEWWQEAIVSVTLVSAWMFTIISGPAADHFGRKPVIVASSLIFVIGSLIMAEAPNQHYLLVGRFIVGVGVGLASMTVPMYIAEIAPSTIRGQLVIINVCCITGGQFIASVVAYAASYIHGESSWRLMLGLAAVPALIQFLAFLAMPESPRWLINKASYDEAKKVLRRIRASDADVDLEFEAIKANCLRAKLTFEASNSHEQPTWRRILENQPVRRALAVGCFLNFIQQVAGINTVMYYSASIFEMAGVHSKREALLLSSVTALVNFVFTLVGMALVERVGRRKLTLSSLLGVALSLIVLALSFQIAYVNSPRVSQAINATQNGHCGTYSDCSACSRDPVCGFCFQEDPDVRNKMLSATCLLVNTSHHEQSVLPHCNKMPDFLEDDNPDSSQLADDGVEYIWAFQWCPSAYSWLTLLGMVLYLVFFAPGMGPMPWTINSEIYPSWARSWCFSAATSVGWMTNVLVSVTFLTLTMAITKQGAFFLYASFTLLGFVVFYFVLPETRGKTLEQLEELFAKDNNKKQSRDSSDSRYESLDSSNLEAAR